MKIEVFVACIIVIGLVYALTDGFEPARPPSRPMAPTNLQAEPVTQETLRANTVAVCPHVEINDELIELGDACMYNERGELIGVHLENGWITSE